MVGRALGAGGNARNWMENRRLDRETMCVVRAKAHLLRRVSVDNLRKESSSLSLADVAEMFKEVQR